jgi:phosphoenolpyruvate synthase/pyruvate phosphate dikinase
MSPGQQMSAYVLALREVGKSKVGLVGGKGANLGELSRIEGIRVPEGFCLSTEAFERSVGELPSMSRLLAELSLLRVEDRAKISALSGELRKVIAAIAIPEEIGTEISRRLAELGEDAAYAVRSSATAEDLPTASFAGQQDTYLNVVGRRAILEGISSCWASLFSERAVTYRLQQGVDQRKVTMAVVVQKMVSPQVAGVLFTADPVSASRKVSSIDASFGLGDALVAGLVNPDGYRVRNGTIIDKKIATKKQALTDAQILELDRLGRKIEAHFGAPQDIEWCLVDGAFHFVQSRPITTLYPIPKAPGPGNHVYVSVGHQQMMTDAMKPLGLSVRQLNSGGGMYSAGGRLFADATRQLSTAAGRDIMLNVLGKSDPLIRGALTTLLEREDFLPLVRDDKEAATHRAATSPAGFRTRVENDPAIVADLVKSSQASVGQVKRDIQTKAGVELIDFVLEDIQKLKKELFDPKNIGAIMAAMDAASWLNESVNAWLGEKNVADTLSQSVPDNVTSAMGLELMDVADVIRPHPEVVAYLQGYVQQARDDDFLDELGKLDGGQQAVDAIRGFLDKYGMRCPGEIDITRTRWSERPAALIPILLSNVRNFEPKASVRKFEQGRREALAKEQELLERLKRLPDGEQKAAETKQMISLVRTFSGYREYPKYAMMNRYILYKQALLKEAERLRQAGVVREAEDIYYLTLEELREVVRTHEIDPQVIDQRKDDFRRFEKLTPPRVITSDGEIPVGQYSRENLPAEAIVGLAVSSGVVEGRARVVLNMADADLEAGDILVTAFTDPSWTPLFVSIKGLVTEVGGLMTHGSVIAREYGLPAVVGVENATRLIKDGQRIRVHGTEGYVEIL